MTGLDLFGSAGESGLRPLLEAAPSAVLITDQDGRILFANSRTEVIFGYDENELLGQPIEHLMPKRYRTPHLEHRAHFLDAPATRPMGMGRELVAQRKDGTEFPAEIGLGFVSQGERIQTIAFVADVSVRKLAEEALHQRTRELEARNEELDAYAHTVAHDLKNPLALLVGFTDYLREEHATLTTDQVVDYLQRISRIGHKMSNIVEELLLLAGVRKMDVELQPIDMGSVVAGALERLSDLLQRHDAELLQPETWPKPLAYGPWVEEVWANYVSNAIKYGGRPPRVELGVDRLDNGMLRFWVQDNGRGLSAQDQERLFMPFTQLDQAQTGGHGLGLSIVRRIVEKLGGEVAVESAGVAGEGSRFSFTLAAALDQVS
ncbi:MAG: PAS domain-containing sensor histidine kinase [Anaerolineae bacterium]|jgi:PAS domain S-box-containing protein